MADDQSDRSNAHEEEIEPRTAPTGRKEVLRAPIARQIAPLTRSGARQPPSLSGPVNDVLQIELTGDAELVWSRIINFVNGLDNTDVLNVSNDYKLQAYHYALPRFVLFRMQLFRGPERMVVEFQRREGDAYLHNILFQHLRAILTSDNEENDSPVPIFSPSSSSQDGYSPYENLEPDNASQFTQIDLRQSEQDLSHWLTLLAQPTLNSTQSGASAIALATQNTVNFPILISEADGILNGMLNSFQHSEDAPTIFSLSIILSTLATESEWCSAILRNNMIGHIIAQIHKWCGLKKLKSTQIVINLLLCLRHCIEHLGPEEFLSSASREDIDRLFALQKGMDTELSVLLESVLTKLNV